MKPITVLSAALAAGLLLALAPDSGAQTLYKLIDKNGKVTYSEKLPKDFDGKVIRLDINPEQNTATLPKPAGAKGEEARRETEAEKIIRRSDTGQAERLQAARDKLEAAKKALADAAANASDSDYRLIGNVGGGTRRVPTEDFAARLAGLEQDVKAAEEELKNTERGR